MQEEFERKKERAFEIIKQKKMWKSNYAPPLLRILWRCGINMPLFPFAPFWLNMTIMSVWFGVPVTLVSCILSLNEGNACANHIIAQGVISTLFYGFFMAAFHAWARYFYRLPTWAQL